MHRRWTGWGSFVLLAVAVSALPAWCAEGIEGRWEGAIQIGATNLGIVVEFAGQGDELRATIDIPQQGASGLGLTNVRFAPPRVRFDLPAGPGLAEFDGELKEDGSIGGSFEQAGARGTFSMKRAAAAPAAEAAAPPPAIEGRWSGAIEIAGSRLGISVAFARVGSRMSATIDIPEQDAEGLPLNNVRAEGSRVSFELPAGPGLAVFDGTLQERRIGGSFRQGGMAGTFHLEP
ncbi:MAG: hypothetical protein KBD01_11395, partial [Acidobacteria bacterium]|nr:hypothetical protein [Acidobacteriota bacterium]